MYLLGQNVRQGYISFCVLEYCFTLPGFKVFTSHHFDTSATFLMQFFHSINICIHILQDLEDHHTEIENYGRIFFSRFYST